jgi:FMN reductase
MQESPRVVGMGGGARSGSCSERALRAALHAAEAAGACTTLLTGADLDLPMYKPGQPIADSTARLLQAIHSADGLLIASPSYHSGIPGRLKNAIDHLEALRDDPRPYLDGRGVGLIACAAGGQAGVNTLAALRSVVHALRGWPTPLGVVLNSAEALDDGDDAYTRLALLARQVVEFARAWQTQAPMHTTAGVA